MRSILKSLCIGALYSLSCLSYSATSVAQSYGAVVDRSEWTLDRTVFSCALTHIIPYWGQARLVKESGEPEYLELLVNNAQEEPGLAQLQYVKERSGDKKILGEVNTDSGLRLASIQGALLDQILHALEEGARIEWRLVPLMVDLQARPDTQWYISNVGFLTPYRGYQACLARLPTVSFDQVAESRLEFAFNTMRLTAEAEKLLEYVLLYHQFQGPLRSIVITGHSDSVGSFVNNSQLSYERAWVVKDWLVYAGIPPAIIRVRGVGGSHPIASNATPEGRARNRRVELEITR